MDVFEFFSGEYKILEKVGQGAMGAVFKAESIHLERTVAIKVLPPELSKDKDFIKRFLREMQTILGLDHDNIVRALDCGIDLQRDIYFAVMEFVEGETIQCELNRDKKLSIERALELTRQAALGLQHAHEKNVIHRDIKPENLMINQDGQIKIADFGLAKTRDSGEASITNKGDILGTPHYISPEASMGEEEVDIRGDIYSLGVTLYHMLSGRPPFIEGNPMQVVLAHSLQPMPPITKFNPDLPENVVKLVDKMTYKARSLRFSSPQEVVEAVDAIA